MQATETSIHVDPDHVGFLCHECRDRMSFATDSAPQYDGRTYCESCFDERFTKCEHCEDSCPCDETTTVDGQEWCQQCTDDEACHCEDCGDWVDNENSTYAADRSLCTSCYKESYFFCYECQDDCHNDDYGDDGRCKECAKAKALSKITRLMERWNDPTIRTIRVSRDDSLASGNCTCGTDDFISEYFPHIYDWACVTIGQILDTVYPDGPDALVDADADFAKQVGAACLFAIKRHKQTV